MDDINNRIQLAVESILENESLTADIDDDAANELIQWGTDCAEKIVKSSSVLKNIDDIDNMVNKRLKAVRKMMRQISLWIANRQFMDDGIIENILIKILEQVKIIYNKDINLPTKSQQKHFLKQSLQLSNDPVKMVLRLRMLIEDKEDYQNNI